MRRIISLWLPVAFLFLLLPRTSEAQTTYDNVPANFVNVNSGNPGWATFYFGHPVNGQPGTFALVIQCIFHRAEFFTNYDAQGQAQSHFFAVTCSSPTGSPNTAVLDSTPLAESLVMVNTDGSTFNLNLTINSATWTVTYPGTRSQKASGQAEVVVGSPLAALPFYPCGSKYLPCPGTLAAEHKPGTCWWDGKGADWMNIQCLKEETVVLTGSVRVQ